MYRHHVSDYDTLEGMKAIPVPIRECIMKLYGQGKATAQIAQNLGYCEAAVRRVRQHHRERGTLAPHPIENMWSKVKEHMRGLAPRTQRKLFGAFASAIGTVTPSDCKGFFSCAGYDT